MGVKCNVTPLGCCSNSIIHLFSAIITPYTDFDFYGVLWQHLNFNSVVTGKYIGVAFLMQNVAPTVNISVMCGIYVNVKRFAGLKFRILQLSGVPQKIFMSI